MTRNMHETETGAMNRFAMMDTIEAVMALNDLEQEGNPAALPELFEYIDLPGIDEATEIMARNLVHTLIEGRKDYVLLGLAKGGPATQDICVFHAGRMGLKEAAPVLVEKLEHETDSSEIQELLRALGNMADPALAKLIREYISDRNTFVAMAAIEALGSPANTFVAPELVELLSGDDSLRACSAAEALGKIGDPVAVKGLAEHIHHDHSVVRKTIITALANLGDKALGDVSAKLKSVDHDEVIMAANVLGMIGSAKAIDGLNTVTKHDNANVRFAVYEALGLINSMQASLSLVPGLRDEDFSVVCAVVTGLEQHPVADVVVKVTELLNDDDAARKSAVKAVVDTRATALFKHLFNERRLMKDIVDQLAKTKSKEGIEAFLEASDAIDNKVTQKGVQALLNKALKNIAVGSLTILAADDSKTMRYLYESTLPELGYDVITAVDGEDLVEQFKTHKVDLIITDMNMPGKNGIEATKSVREDLLSSIPIIMVTTESQSSQKQEATAAGVNDFLTKPFTSEGLGEAIVRLTQA